MIENRQGGKTSETLLLSHQARPNLARKQQDQRALRINNQASIDLGMLHQARSQLQPVWRPQERSSESNKEQLGEEIVAGADWCFAENGLDAYRNG